MDLSIIIPAYNEEDYLPITIQRLKEAISGAATIEFNWELIVCDNNSSDNTPAVARQLGAHVVFEPENHISKARNRGASQAIGNWLLFMDADTYPNKALMTEVFSLIFQDQFIGCGVTVSVEGSSLFNKLRMERLNPIFRSLKIAGGAFLLCRRDSFEAIGGFSEGLFAYEEIDFIFRLKKYGKSIGRRFVVLHQNPVLTSGRKGVIGFKSITTMVISNLFAVWLFLMYYLWPNLSVQKWGKSFLGYWYAQRK